MTFYLISKFDHDIRDLSEAIANLKAGLKICSVCYNFGESDPCEICADEKRNEGMICVVEEPLDVLAIERAGFSGLYHVLGGVISPINGIGPEDIRVRELISRTNKNSAKIKEIILATNPTLEGEATAVYIRDRIKGKNISITRLARGLPAGGDLEYADEITLARSLEGRKEA